MVELFTARFRQEDAFRDLKQRLGWEECRAWTANPIQRTKPAVGDDEPAAVVAAPAGGVWEEGLVGPAAVEQEEGSTQRAGRTRLMRKHREQISVFSKWEGSEGILREKRHERRVRRY